MNRLYGMMNNTNNNPIMEQFKQFKQTFKGDAKEQVQQLLNSGQISQEQYNNAVKMANQFQSMFK